MVFFVTKSGFIRTIILSVLLVAAIGYTAPAAYGKSAGPHYPDIDVRTVSDEHVVVRYTPLLSDDLLTVGRVAPYRYGDGYVHGRAILVAVPPEGDLSYTVTFGRAGYGLPVDGDKYISSKTPLVIREPAFSSRGHRLVRLVIFPQRVEDGRLAVYTDFVIDITFRGRPVAVEAAELSRLDSVLAGTVVNPDQFFRFGSAVVRQAAFKQAVNPFSGSDTWVRVAVAEDGITRVNGAHLAQAGIDLSDVGSNSLRMFYAGGVNPSDTPSVAGPPFYQISIGISDGGDGRFESGDHLLFYAEAASRYEYESGQAVYRKNPYNDRNYYWLAVGGHTGDTVMRWGTKNGTPSANPDVVTHTSRRTVRAEQDNVIKVDSDGRIRNYFDWYWSNESDEEVMVFLDHYVPGDSTEVIVSGVSGFSGSTVTLNGYPMSGEYISNDLYRFWDNVGAGVPGLNRFEIHLSPVVGNAYLDYFDINYPMYLRYYAGGQLEFNSSGNAGFTVYKISGYTSSHHVLDITDRDHPAVIFGVEIFGDTARFERPELATSMSRYAVYAPNDVFAPVSVESAAPGALRDDIGQYDCIVVAPRSFHGALQEYVQYRQSTDGYRVKLAAVEDIYNDFGFGLRSPMAIRSYLKYAYEHFETPAPFAALLVGDGHYDFLDNLELHAPIYIPPFIWGREFSAGDDNYVYFGDLGRLDSDSSYIYETDRGWDMMIARWPVRSVSEVSAHMEAIKRYESPETKGSWRSRITYVADDEFKGGFANEIIHTAQAETLAVLHTPSEFVKQKIYLTDYPFASNGEKPTVTDDIIKAVNEGTLMINYIGHGSPDVWADEHVLRKSRDLGRMQNPDKPTVVVAGSCSIGFFDDPGREGMAELMFRMPGAGIETVSATRLVYATDNAIFNYDLYDGIFGQRLNVSEATYAAKVLHQYGFNFSLIRNDRSYVVFGDPLGRFGIPEYGLVFDRGDSVLTPLEQFAFSGMVVDEDENPVSVDGVIDIAVYDSRIVKHHPLGVDYTLGGPVIFRGTVEVQNGAFSGGFVVPLDIDYGGYEAQVAGYCNFGTVSAIGGLDSLFISLTAASTDDNTGPRIGYRFEEVPGFVSGELIPANATAIVEFEDVSGINLTGGLGHRIELVIDNDNSSTINLTDRFTYAQGSFQRGELRFAMPDLTPELHSFRITVWDNANNPASVEFEAVPSMESRIVIRDVLNWPNPMEEYTEFFFDLSESAEWVQLQIFTLAGRLIKSFRSEDIPIGRNRRFLWDGRDLDGDRVAQGVYIYKIFVHGRSGAINSSDAMAEAFGKLVVLN